MVVDVRLEAIATTVAFIAKMRMTLEWPR